MKVNLTTLNKNILKIFKDIGSVADRQGVTVYVVGGFVRDLILKQENLDIDVVVEKDAIALAQFLAKAQKATAKIYNEFGTATFFYPNGFRVDFATARQEVYDCPGALPTVRRGSIHDDLFRRDFTINAMAMVVNKRRFGELVDIFGGLSDLKHRQVRILHSKSFRDDPTRVLRAIRFEQRLDFCLEQKTFVLLKSAIQNDYFKYVTLPRYFEEFKKILKEAHPAKAIGRLRQLQGFKFFKNNFRPNMATLDRLEGNVAKLKKRNLYKNYGEWWLIYLAGMMESRKDSEVKNLIDSLNLTREQKSALLNCGRARSAERKLKARNLMPRQVYQILKPLGPAIIHFIRAKTSVNIVNRYVDDFLRIYSKVKLRVTGRDLKRLGIPADKEMGKILSELFLRKVDGKLTSRAKELKEVLKVKTILQEKE